MNSSTFPFEFVLILGGNLDELVETGCPTPPFSWWIVSHPSIFVTAANSARQITALIIMQNFKVNITRFQGWMRVSRYFALQLTRSLREFYCKSSLSDAHYSLANHSLFGHGSIRCSSQSAQISNKPNYNVGTIGHIDHGKTTLTAAITQILAKQGLAKPVKFDEIDKAKEEKKRGITINIAHIGYESKNRRYSHTDCPGHSDFIKNMICGTAQMDAAVLVIAATDGVMAQTKEHLILARQIGLKHIVIFINKSDLVEEDVLDLVEIEARELLTAHGFDGDNTPVIRGSALNALEGKDETSINELLKALDALPEPLRNESEALIMPVSSKTAITGRGTVVVGTIEQGILKKGDKVEIKGDDKEVSTVASDIQVFGKSVKEVRAGDHCGVLCRGVKADQVTRGMWMGHIGAVHVTNHVKAELYLLSEEENGRRVGIRSGFTDKLFCSTWDQVARFELSQELLMPGEHTQATVILMRNMPFKKGIPFTLRDGGTKQTIARGLVSELLEPVTVEHHNLKKAAHHDE